MGMGIGMGGAGVYSSVLACTTFSRFNLVLEKSLEEMTRPFRFPFPFPFPLLCLNAALEAWIRSPGGNGKGNGKGNGQKYEFPFRNFPPTFP